MKTTCPKCGCDKDHRSLHCRKCVVRERPREGMRNHFPKNGYVYVMVGGKCLYEHRYVMEQALGRKLQRTEHVHHINHDRKDNRLENLELLDGSEHHRLHMTEQWAEIHAVNGRKLNALLRI